MRLVLSGTAASSLMMTSTFLPATVSPCCAWKSLIAAASCLPVDCCWPVIGRMKPILTVSSQMHRRLPTGRARRRRRKSSYATWFPPKTRRSLAALRWHSHSGGSLSRSQVVSSGTVPFHDPVPALCRDLAGQPRHKPRRLAQRRGASPDKRNEAPVVAGASRQ